MEEKSDSKAPIIRDIRRYYCQYCGICRSKKPLITSHVLSNHQEEVKEHEFDDDKEGPSLNVCEKCGAEFKKPAHLKQHLLSHSLEIELCVKHWIPNKDLQNAKLDWTSIRMGDRLRSSFKRASNTHSF